MPVGAGSIKRAAKLNAGAEKTETSAKKVMKEQEAETVATVEETKLSDKKITDKKSTENKKATDKKTTGTKSTAKRTVKKTAEKKTATQKDVKQRADVQVIGSNQVCHLTEELPIYLL